MVKSAWKVPEGNKRTFLLLWLLVDGALRYTICGRWWSHITTACADPYAQFGPQLMIKS